MIHQFRCSTHKKLGMLALYLLTGISFMGFTILMFSAVHIPGTIVFAAFFACSAYGMFVHFVRRRIHEIYLISRRTLAVISPKRPVRFLKLQNFSSYRPLFNDFRLADNSKFACWIPGDEQKFAIELITLWYGDSAIAASRGRGTVDLRRLAFPDVPPIQRFPRVRPRWERYAATYFIALSVISAPIVSAIASIVLLPPQETEAWFILGVSSALFLSPVALYFGLRCYKLFVRGDLYTTVVISPRTLCVLQPRKPVRYIKRDQCRAFLPGLQPSSGCIELVDGTRVGFGFADVTSEAPGPTTSLWRRWWPFVPERLRVVSPVREYTSFGMAAVGLALALEGHANDSVLRFAGGAALLALAVLYLCTRICGTAKYHTVPLSPEYYSNDVEKTG